MFNEKWLIYEVLSGSRAYGLNTESSDYDWRGVCVPDKEFFISPFKTFKQYITTKPEDRTIFNLTKFISLATNCNPNVVELLFVDEKHIKFINKKGQALRDNAKLFLTGKAKFTYTGYAYSQLHRIKNHKRWFDNPIKEPKREDFGLEGKTNKIFENSLIKSLISNFKNYLAGDLVNGLTEKTNVDKDLLNSMIGNILNDVPKNFFSEFSTKFFSHLSGEMVKEEYNDVLKKEYNFFLKYKEWKEYETWKRNRNPDRAKTEEKYSFDIKHGSHLLRLLYQGKEILLTGNLTVDVSNIDNVVKCKRGELSYDKLLEISDSLNNEINEIYKEKKFVVPNRPNIKEIEKLTMNLLSDIL